MTEITIKKLTDLTMGSNSGRVDMVYFVNKMATNNMPAKTLKSLGLNIMKIT